MSSAPRSIVLLISSLEYGGAQRQVVELANSMDPDLFDVHVCSLSDYVPLGERLRDRQRRLHIIRKRFKFDLSVVPRLAILLRTLRADVVHGFLFDAEIAARLAGRMVGAAVLGSERSTGYELNRNQLIAYRLTRGWVDRIIANSRTGAAFNQRTLNYDPAKYLVVHNGVDTERFRPGERAAARAELNLGADQPVVGMFASFKQQKNHTLMFAALRRLADRMPDVRLLLVGEELFGGKEGSDDYRERMHRLIDELGIREHCLLVGNRDDVARLYSACDVTVLSSVVEGTPNVLLESMACGVPVVATDISDNSYIVPQGRVGYLVPLGDDAALADRLAEILSDRQLRDELGQRARSWVVDEFSTARLASRMGAIYVSLLDARPSVEPAR